MSPSPGGWQLIAICVLMILGLRWSGRMRARRLGRRDLADAREYSALDERLSRLEQLEGRVAELENRLDFTERLLARKSGAHADP